MTTTQTAQAAPPVINLKTRSAASVAPRRATSVEHPDAALIEQCIEVAMAMAGADVCYDIDPTDSEFATTFDTRAQRRVDKALGSITDLQAVTMDGLRAKASLVDLVIRDWRDSINPEDPHGRFLSSVAKDVVQHQRAARHEKRSDVRIEVSP